jgi:pyrroloquinoline quinone biosynthesis protein B
MNASPDLHAQIGAFPPLHPELDSGRNSPIAGVLLTNADLDHIYGLPLLRESPAVAIHASAAVRESVERSGIAQLLGAFSHVTWHEAPGQLEPLRTPDGRATAIDYRFIPLPGGPPRFQEKSAHATGHSGAFWFEDANSGGRLLVAPDVAAIPPELLRAISEADIILFDGTFWTSDELRHYRPDARSAEEMGHLPIRDGSLPILRAAPARHKAYVHINNTNPILSPDSSERFAVEEAGVAVAFDGMEFHL